MFPNYYPFYSYPNNSYYNTYNSYTKPNTTSNVQKDNVEEIKEGADNEKKDIVNDTIPFENYYNSNHETKAQNSNNTNSRFFNFNKQEISIGNITLQTDDLLIMGIIILLFIESEDNMLLIIVLGLLLLNINLGDILNFF